MKVNSDVTISTARISHPDGMVYFLPFFRNIVSTVNLGCKLDLKTIALRARNAEYNPKVSINCYSSFAQIIVRAQGKVKWDQVKMPTRMGLKGMLLLV